MDSFFPILIGIACALGAILVGFSFSKDSKKHNKGSTKNRRAIIADAEKKLKQDPRNPAGLVPLAELYFQENAWDKAFPLYETIVEISTLHLQIDRASAALRSGICAIKLGKIGEALKSLAIAQKGDLKGFEVNFYLGQALYLSKQYDKAILFLKRALVLNPDIPEVYEFLGLSLHEMRLYRESLLYLKKALDLVPENRALLFAMAEALYNCGNVDRALKIFLHLRPDPKYGARASLFAGTIHMSQKQTERTIQDYEIGLKHVNASSDVLNQIRYNLAQAYLATSDIAKALTLLHGIQITAPGYKDTALLIGKYQEMNQNNTLKTYLLAGNSDFIALCRKMVSVFYSNAHVKILAVDAKPDVAEIQAEIETPKWEDTVVFRFYRNTGDTGEFLLRDFYGRIQDLKAGKGICITAGTYTTDAKKFVEGRPIDLVNKNSLLKVFDKASRTKSL